MTLLQDIQNAAIDAACPMSTLLRKCSVLAARLKNDELRTWTSRELNGYESDAELPSYRVLAANTHGNLAGPFGAAFNNAIIPSLILPKEIRHFAEEIKLRPPISELEALTENDETNELICHWPGNVLLFAQKEGQFANDFILNAAWQSVSKARVVGIIDTVRNRVLEFVLQLENEAPAAGEPEKPGSTVPAEKVTQLFQTIIHGDVVGNVATGNHAVLTTGSVTVQKGDLEALTKLLRTWGVPRADLDELQQALKDDPETPTIGDKPKTSGWLSSPPRAPHPIGTRTGRSGPFPHVS